MNHRLRKILFFTPTAIFIAFIFSGINASAQDTQSGYRLLAPFPTIGKPTGITLVDYMKGLFVATIGLAIVLAVVELVIGGIEYVAAAVPSSKEDAKKRIGGAVGGLLLILLAWVLLQALNPKLLNVGLNLKDVTVSGGPPGGGGPPPPPPSQWCCYGKITGQQLGSPYPNESDCKASCNGLAQECRVCGGGGGNLNCKNGKCATNPAIANAVKNNSSGVDPNIIMAIIDGGEGCNRGTSSAGACGYSQVMPKYRRTVCGLTGTDAQTCAAMQNDINLDINCGAKFLKTDFIPRCGPSITTIASCYNTGSKNNCGQNNYCQRVTKYYNSCLTN